METLGKLVNNRNIPNIAGIRVSCNFCEDFKTADLVIMLPSKISQHTGQAEVKVTHSLLQERDFRCLEGAIHLSGRRKVCIRSFILANQGVIHSVPNAVGMEWITPGLPRM